MTSNLRAGGEVIIRREDPVDHDHHRDHYNSRFSRRLFVKLEKTFSTFVFLFLYEILCFAGLCKIDHLSHF